MTFDVNGDGAEDEPKPLERGAALVRAYAAFERRGHEAVPEKTRRALEALGYVR
jgi:hypothetical protein